MMRTVESGTRQIAQRLVMNGKELLYATSLTRQDWKLIDAFDEALRNERERCAGIAETHDRTHSSGYRCYEGEVIAERIRHDSTGEGKEDGSKE